MIQNPGTEGTRPLKSVHLTADLVVVGGGLAGTCAAIAAARAGTRVVLVQDRPVLEWKKEEGVRYSFVSGEQRIQKEREKGEKKEEGSRKGT
jgi:thioredoxin reductase